MANKIALIETKAFQTITSAQQAHLEAMLGRVCGAKLYSFKTIEEAMHSAVNSECVIVIPAEIVSNKTSEVVKTLTYIENNKPFSRFFAILFVLYPSDEKFFPAELSSAFWINLLDKFYDEAVPTSFAVMYCENPEIQAFHISSTVTGLFRDLDNLTELSKIQSIVSDLERRIKFIEADI